METIDVRRSGDAYEVTVSEEGETTRHTVTATDFALKRLAPGYEGNEIIRAAFRFLLDREPKEAILKRFEIGVITEYFPDFAAQLSDYLLSR